MFEMGGVVMNDYFVPVWPANHGENTSKDRYMSDTENTALKLL